MKRQSLIILIIPALMLFFATALIIATEYGTISGQITDSQTKQPLAGVAVIVVGTNWGTITDADGKFVIYRVPPGSYTLKVTSIGYQALEIKNVQVKPELTVIVNNALTQKPEELGEKVAVEAECGIINKFETSNQTIITKDSRLGKPAELSDLQFQFDGVPKSSGCFTPPQSKEKRIYQQGYGCIVPPYRPPYESGPVFDNMFFKNYGVNPFINAADDYQSTFAVDVDDASYSLCRSYLNQSALPPADAIRTEEFINHFDYSYPANRNETFSIYLEGAPSRYGDGSQLLKIGIKGKALDEECRQPANLVFVVDVSGSMARENRISLVQNTLRLVTDQLYHDDRIGIVAYNQSAQIILEPTPVRQKGRILAAIDKLYPSGSTNCQAGLRLGFQMAWRYFDPKKTNRVFLFSDGVANTGNTDPETMLREIKPFTDRGITLSSIGVGMGNYNDVLMEKLGDKGNGFYAYIDDIGEAKSVFKENLTSALQVIARDVKVQVEFDPDLVSSYRLLGYENRNVADYQFRDDQSDGGEIGPGHSVTALYEINFKRPQERGLYGSPRDQHVQNIGRIFVRYENPESGAAEEIGCDIAIATFTHRFSKCSPEFKLAAAAAEFGEIMRDSYWARNSSLNDVLQMASEVYRQTGKEDVREFVNLVTKARDLRAFESDDYFSKE